ncbi:hypothetical protein LMG32289_03914 [Cupriavidus pampae]|uniref:Uncharacterized protein n=1 Tax=Cupriavidus pampae TaxID=659251 RepID=A0ABN7YZ20_9BURK|nr:hypothetical protein LMG32289_03914 [Cupriavidus pampae]
MLNLYDGDNVQEDLDRIRQVSLADGDLLDVFLTQIAESREAIWSLSQRAGEHPDPLFSVKVIECFQQRGFNVSRIRPLRLLSQYRVIVAFDAQNDDFYVLAVVRKKPHDAPAAIDPDSYDYEPDHPLSHRVCDEYDDLGIPRIRLG